MPNKPFALPKDNKLQYHMSMEQNDGLQKSTYELEQYYDGPGNRAATFFKSNGVEIRVYVNGSNNEQYTYVPCCNMIV